MKPGWVLDSIAANKLLSCKFLNFIDLVLDGSPVSFSFGNSNFQ